MKWSPHIGYLAERLTQKLFEGRQYLAAHVRLADAHWERTDCKHTINGKPVSSVSCGDPQRRINHTAIAQEIWHVLTMRHEQGISDIYLASNINCTDYRVQTMAGMLKAKRVRLVCDQPKLYELAGGDNFIASLIEQEVSRILDGVPVHGQRERASKSRRHLLRCRCVPVHRPLLVQNIRHGPTPSTESAHMKTVIRPLLSRTSGQ